MKISLICACKNRNEALRVSLNSWLNYSEISEIIIVDWKSDKPLKNLTQLDERIKIIRVDDVEYFNQPQPLNLAAQQATGDYILKVDCDYIMSPYYSFFNKYKIDENSFVSGKSSIKSPEFYDEESGLHKFDKMKMSVEQIQDYYNSYSSYYRYLTGLLFVSKEHFINIGGYNESFSDFYSFEDDEIYKRLEIYGLEHKKLDFDYHLIHMPHPDNKRFENFRSTYEQREIRDIIRANLSGCYSGDDLEWQTDYVLAMKHNQINRAKVDEVSGAYVKCETKWIVSSEGGRYYTASIDNNQHQLDKNKLKNLPPVNFISVEHSEERRENLYKIFSEYGILEDHITPHIFKKYDDSEHQIQSGYLHRLSIGSRGPVTSHLKAIKEWLNDTEEEYAFFCEDDISLESVKYWDFTWEEFFNSLPPQWECVQLCLLREYEYGLDIKFKTREWSDWSGCAYLISRKYAQKLIDTYYYDDVFHLDSKCHDVEYRPDWAIVPVIETIIFGLSDEVYVIPLFLEDISFKASYQIDGEDDNVNVHHHNSHNIVLNKWKEMAFKLNQSKEIPNKIKFVNFPSVYYISLEESVERRNKLNKQFFSCGVEKTVGVISKRFSESDDKLEGEQLHILDDGTKGCVVSHIKMIKKWYDETDEEYAFFCEDDLSLETVNDWNFSWTEFIQSLPEDAECVQLCCVRDGQEEVRLRDRSMYDWSVTAYILTRGYAKKIIDHYFDNNTYTLNIPNSNFYPMPENVIFYGLGKVYSINLFVEDQNHPSTFYGKEGLSDKNKAHHVETYKFVTDWWKNNNVSLGALLSVTSEKDTEIVEEKKSIGRERTELEQLLYEYSLDCEDAQKNYNLGIWYEKEGHTAPALSYFLRAAERFESEDMQYEAIIKCHHCYDKQGTRDGTAESLLQQALCIKPTRPEAYFLLARFHEKRSQWSHCYQFACQGLTLSDFDSPKTTHDVEYPGRLGLLFEKASSGWYWGKVEESKEIFLDLIDNYNLTPYYHNLIVDNLKHYDIEREKK